MSSLSDAFACFLLDSGVLVGDVGCWPTASGQSRQGREYLRLQFSVPRLSEIAWSTFAGRGSTRLPGAGKARSSAWSHSRVHSSAEAAKKGSPLSRAHLEGFWRRLREKLARKGSPPPRRRGCPSLQIVNFAVSREGSHGCKASAPWLTPRWREELCGRILTRSFGPCLL